MDASLKPIVRKWLNSLTTPSDRTEHDQAMEQMKQRMDVRVDGIMADFRKKIGK